MAKYKKMCFSSFQKMHSEVPEKRDESFPKITFKSFERVEMVRQMMENKDDKRYTEIHCIILPIYPV